MRIEPRPTSFSDPTLVFLIILHFVAIANVDLRAREMPHIQRQNGTGQLIADGRPFLIRGGELGNSSADTAAEADAIVPNVARLHVNTILMPVAWEQIEPKEGSFDFSILDHWIDVASENHVRLILLWFGSWKNAFSSYAPAWVKQDTRRFPRAQAADGAPLEILSALSEGNRRSDSRAFRSLMRHVREKDAESGTVLMVQVENEVGYLGWGRDRSEEANALFRGPVPDKLITALAAKRGLSPELTAHFDQQTNQGKDLLTDPHQPRIYRVRLYAIPSRRH